MENRLKQFKKNELLEKLLKSLNEDLWVAEKELIKQIKEKYPILFIVGAHRSGTTLLLQWFANTGVFSYPTNLLSRFYNAPIIGAKIQLLLTDKRYNFRDEILDFNSEIEYKSENGKTKGALSPNEFWYFWRRFLPFKEIDYIPSEKLKKIMDTETFRNELYGIANVFQKPLVLKAMIMNYNIDLLNEIFDNSIFIYIKRNPLSNIESALEARKRQFGNINEWYSFKIPEYYELIKLNPYEQVAGQIYYINKSIKKGLETVPKNKKIVINYEDFCKNPQELYNELKIKLNKFNINLKEYNGANNFNITRKYVKDKNIISAYNLFYKKS